MRYLPFHQTEIFWPVTSCNFIVGFRSFSAHNFDPEDGGNTFLKNPYSSAKLHDATNQKTIMNTESRAIRQKLYLSFVFLPSGKFPTLLDWDQTKSLDRQLKRVNRTSPKWQMGKRRIREMIIGRGNRNPWKETCPCDWTWASMISRQRLIIWAVTWRYTTV
jgi:hypothetical protein